MAPLLVVEGERKNITRIKINIKEKESIIKRKLNTRKLNRIRKDN